MINVNAIHPTREAWLEAAVSELAPDFMALGGTLPAKIRVSCAFTSGGTRKRGGKAMVGECWDSSRSGDKAFEIMVSPIEDDPYRVLAILTHELCHAAAGIAAGHRGQFATLARGMALVGPLTATTGDKDFKVRVDPILKTLGLYPHAKLDTSKRTKQTTRLVKCQCQTCGYTVRTTSKWIVSIGTPICPGVGLPQGGKPDGTHGAMKVV